MENYSETIKGKLFPISVPYYLNCLKSATTVELTVEYGAQKTTGNPYFWAATLDGISTEVSISFRSASGASLHGCTFRFFIDEGRGPAWFPGAGSDTGEFSASYDVVQGGTDPDPGGSGAIASLAEIAIGGFDFGETDAAGDFVPIYAARGIAGLTPADLIGILTDQRDSYERFIDLFAGDSFLRGTAGADELEPGAGNDLVRGGLGDDIVTKWRPGDLTYDGGAGIDTIEFFPSFTVWGTWPPLVETLVIDLLAGTGRNPYGGALTLTSVEVVQLLGGVADIVFGSNRGETVASASDGDVLELRKGDDLVTSGLAPGGPGLTVDGGGGTDTVSIGEIYLPSVLDLGDPAANSGVFAGCSFTRVEAFELHGRSGTGGMLLDFFGTGGADVVGYFATFLFPGNPIGAATLHLRGGDDSAHGGGGDDILHGGAGNDTLAGGNAVPNQNAGDDRLYGGAGRDRLDGGGGDDTQTGGAAHDVFVFADGFGDDRVTDFVPDRDRLDFRGHTGIDSFNDLRFADRAAGALVKDGAGNSVLLLGVAVDDLTEADFLI